MNTNLEVNKTSDSVDPFGDALNNIPESDLTKNPTTLEEMVKRDVPMTCGKHGAYKGIQVHIPNFGYLNQSKCPECAKVSKQLRAEMEKADLEKEIKLNCELSGIPKRHMTCTFDNYIPKSNKNADVLNFFKSYAESFHPEKSSNILLFGEIDTGKTHLICSLLHTLIERKFKAVFIDANRLFEQQKDAMRDRNISNEDFYERFTKCDLLAIDEFGLSTLTEHERLVMHQIINRRYEAVLPTLICGNSTLDSLADSVGQRSFDRLQSSLRIAVLEASSQ